MSAIPEDPPFSYDSQAPQPAAAPCTLHSIAAILVVSASVPEGVEPRHLVDYVAAHLGNRDHGLHEDIVDELTRKPMQVVGHEIHPALAPVLFPAFEDQSPAKGGGSMSAALDLVLRELHRAKLKWPHFADSLDHALDVLDEERDELAAAILNDDIQGPHGVIREAAQVAAVAIRIIEYCLKAQSREEAPHA